MTEVLSRFARRAYVFDEAAHPRDKAGRFSVKDEIAEGTLDETVPSGPIRDTGERSGLWHLTDDPNFRPDPTDKPDWNSLAGDLMGDARPEGLFVGDPEYWMHAYGYERPYVAEIVGNVTDPPGAVMHEGREHFLQGDMHTARVLTLDEYARETYGEPGWVESYFDDDGKMMSPDSYYQRMQREIGPDYKARSVDEMTPEEIAKYEERFAKYADRPSGPRHAASRFARRAYTFDESAHPRDTSGRFTEKDGDEDGEGGGSVAEQRARLIMDLENAQEFDEPDEVFWGIVERLKALDEPQAAPEAVAKMMSALADPDSGMTISRDGDVPTDGYIVAVEGHSQTIPAAVFTTDREKATDFVDQYLADNAEALDGDGAMLGLWNDPASGNIFFDVVEHVSDREEAIRLGAERDQIAIFDLAALDVVPTGGTGGLPESGVQQATQAAVADDPGGTPEVRSVARRPDGLSRYARRAYTAENFDESLVRRERGRFARKDDGGAPEAEAPKKGGDPTARAQSALRRIEKAIPGVVVRVDPKIMDSLDRLATKPEGEGKYANQQSHADTIEGAAAAFETMAVEYPDVARGLGTIAFGSTKTRSALGEYERYGSDRTVGVGDNTVNLPEIRINVQNITSQANVRSLIGGSGSDTIPAISGGTSALLLAEAASIHEFGHAVHANTGTAITMAAIADPAYDAAANTQDVHISAYSLRNPKEYFAEAFAAYHLGYGDRLNDADRTMLGRAGVNVDDAMIDAADLMAAAVDRYEDPPPDDFEGSIIWEYAAEPPVEEIRDAYEMRGAAIGGPPEIIREIPDKFAGIDEDDEEDERVRRAYVFDESAVTRDERGRFSTHAGEPEEVTEARRDLAEVDMLSSEFEAAHGTVADRRFALGMARQYVADTTEIIPISSPITGPATIIRLDPQGDQHVDATIMRTELDENPTGRMVGPETTLRGVSLPAEMFGPNGAITIEQIRSAVEEHAQTNPPERAEASRASGSILNDEQQEIFESEHSSGSLGSALTSELGFRGISADTAFQPNEHGTVTQTEDMGPLGGPSLVWSNLIEGEDGTTYEINVPISDTMFYGQPGEQGFDSTIFGEVAADEVAAALRGDPTFDEFGIRSGEDDRQEEYAREHANAFGDYPDTGPTEYDPERYDAAMGSAEQILQSALPEDFTGRLYQSAGSGEFNIQDTNGYGGTISFDVVGDRLHVGSMVFDAEVQDKGLGTAMVAALISAAEQMNMSSVEFLANISVGGYAWARMGAYPTDTAWQSINNQIVSRLAAAEGYGVELTPEQKGTVFDLLTGPPQNITKMAELDDPIDVTAVFGDPGDRAAPGESLATGSAPERILGAAAHTVRVDEDGTLPLGKVLLLGTAWAAQVPIGDPTAREEFAEYTAEKEAEKAMAAAPEPKREGIGAYRNPDGSLDDMTFWAEILGDDLMASPRLAATTSRFARRAYTFDEASVKRDTSGRFTFKDDAVEVEQVGESTARNEAWAAQGRAAADNFTGEPEMSASDVAVMVYGGDDAAATAAIDAGFQPGTALALSDSVTQYQHAFGTASGIYEAAQVLQGAQDPAELRGKVDDGYYAYAREIMNAMANGEPQDLPTYSTYAIGGEFEGPNPSTVMTMDTSDGLVRGVGDRGGLVDSMRAAMESGERVEWPMASFGWGGNYQDYQDSIRAAGGGNEYETADMAALRYTKDAVTGEEYPPVLMRLQGPVEGAFVIDGEYEVLTGGKFKVIDIREEEIPISFMLDDYGAPSDEVGETQTVTTVVLEQIEGPKPV